MALNWDSFRSYLQEMGPSWVAGAIAAGPATMGSLITAGGSYDYALLWVVILSAVAGALAQYLAMRLGLLTERGIVGIVTNYLGDAWAWLLVLDVVLAAGVAQLLIMKTVASVSATLTGIDARVWGVVWSFILAAGLATRGYRFLEIAAKALVTGVVIAFIASLFVAPIDISAAVSGLVPSLPQGSALVAAGILGGAVHITLITMHSYTMQARGWTREEYGLATFDVGISLLVAFGIYSVSIFLVMASVLTSGDLSTVEAATALGPLVGESAKWLFLLGLAGAAVSTLGGNTLVPALLIADKLGWRTTIEDNRYRWLLVAIALLSGPGAFIGGPVLSQLALVLAIGTVGTPFAIAIVLYLLNSRAIPEPNSKVSNLGGFGLLLISGGLAMNFVREQIAGGFDLLSGVILVFAAVLGIAMAGLSVKFIREEAALV